MYVFKKHSDDEDREEYFRYISRNPCLFRAAFLLLAFGAVIYTAADLIARVF